MKYSIQLMAAGGGGGAAVASVFRKMSPSPQALMLRAHLVQP